MRKRVLAGLLGAAVVGTSLFPPLGTVPSALANKPVYLCVDTTQETPNPSFYSAKEARALEKENAGVVCSDAIHDH